MSETGEVPTRSERLLTALASALKVLGSDANEVAALRESFEHATRGFDAEKALLLHVRQGDVVLFEALQSSGLTDEEVKACVEGHFVEGVSPSVIRLAIERRASQLIENSLAARPRATASLAGAPYSVMCAPILDPWTGSVLAVLYFQTVGATKTYVERDLDYLAAYARALGQAFGLFLSNAKRYQELEADCKRLKAQSADAPEIIGESEPMARLRMALHETFIPTTASTNPEPILIVGDTGTGKDLVAEYLHYYSPTRRKAHFVAFSCATLRATELSQAILFGHARGAFTGATEAKPGVFRSAHKGTLFLDEIGELPLDAQSLLFRAISSRRVLPLGASEEVPVDVQILLATNRDLASAVREGTFREELYQRIKPLTIQLPALASRPGDIRPLLTHFLAHHEKRMRKRIRGLAPAALRALVAYQWPGNVRELAGVCAALVTHAKPNAQIDVADIAAHCPDVLQGPTNPSAHLATATIAGSLEDARAEYERELLARRLEACQWNVGAAAESLGISVATLYRYLQKHGLRQTH